VLSRQHLVQKNPERENVAPRVHGIARGLLRRHPTDGAYCHALSSQRGLVRRDRRCLRVQKRRLDQLRQPEIQDLDAVGCDHDVCRFEVTVHDSGSMRARQGVRNVDRQAEGFGERRSLPRQHLLEGLSVNQLHHQHVLTIDCQHVVHSHDPGVIEGRSGFRLL